MLFSRDFGGDGQSIIVLHGMFGSSKNWIRIGQFLSSYGRCYALDLRNHGDSPHTHTHTLFDLITDIGEWIHAHDVQKPILVGHSMGGLAAMGYALNDASRVGALVVVDIAPKLYTTSHPQEIEALKLDIGGLRTRKEIDELMAKLIPDQKVRKFLQLNIERDGKGFRYKINVAALEKSTVLADVTSLEGVYTGMTLFVTGELSRYVDKADYSRIRSYFPKAEIETIPGGDHWLHYSAAEQFKTVVGRFIAEVTGSRD